VNPGELNSTQFGAFQSDVLHPQQPFEFEGNTCKIEMGYATVYEPLRINHDKLCSTIGEPEVPVNRAYKIKVKVDGVQDGKHYLKMVTSKGRSRVLHVTYEDGWAITTSKYFGSFTLLRDETKPNVALLRYTRSIPASAETISWSISDAHSGIDDYDLYIDGKWYLLEYEYKTGQVTFNKPQNFKGEKEVKVVVKDACGNTQVQEYNLTFL
jgi:hypothetical protein